MTILLATHILYTHTHKSSQMKFSFIFNRCWLENCIAFVLGVEQFQHFTLYWLLTYCISTKFCLTNGPEINVLNIFTSIFGFERGIHAKVFDGRIKVRFVRVIGKFFVVLFLPLLKYIDTSLNSAELNWNNYNVRRDFNGFNWLCGRE